MKFHQKFFLGMSLEKFGSGRSLQSLFHFVPQRISAATLHATSKRYLWIEGLLFFKLICSRYWNKFSMTRIGNWSWEVNKVLLEFKCSGVCEMDRSGNPTLLGVDWNGAPDPKFLRRDSPKKMKLNFIKKTKYFIMSN